MDDEDLIVEEEYENSVPEIVKVLDDEWTVVTKDGKPSAHFEHTVCVRKGKADILSSFEIIEKVLQDKSI